MISDVILKKTTSIEERLKILNDKKKKLLEQSKEKSRRANQKRLLEIGKLVEKANLQNLDDNLLLGALLEISEKSKDKKNHIEWEKKVRYIEKIESKIIIIFKDKNINSEAKTLLKNLGFRWNSIRNEYYGKGILESIKAEFKSYDCTIESIL